MLFTGLPRGFQNLEQIAASIGLPQPLDKPREPIENMGVLLRRIFDREIHRNYLGVLTRQRRKLPYAYFLKNKISLNNDHPALVRRYWDHDLPNALSGSRRKARRWLTPLLFTYVEQFNSVDPEFLDFSEKFRAAIRDAHSESDLAERIRSLDQSVGFLDPRKAAELIAAEVRERFRRQQSPFDSLFDELDLVNSRLGSATLRTFLAVNPELLRDSEIVFGALQWADSLRVNVARSENDVLFADTMLGTWSGHHAPDLVKKALIEFFLRNYTDPTLAGNRENRWMGVSDGAVQVILRWLAGDALRIFMEILERTADEIWEYRRKFWMAYYDAGHIEEVWLALGREARLVAQGIDASAGRRQYARLAGKNVDRRHSVLLIKIGGLVFSEWSHDGSLRALDDANPRAPTLYRLEYNGEDLRASGTMDFYDGRLENRALIHNGSERGHWQRIARDFIQRHTGIQMRDSEITL